MPTPKKARQEIIRLLPKDHNGTIFELGSGWGTLVFPISKHYPKCKVLGFEASPVPWIISILLQKVFFRFSNLCIFRRDFFDTSLKEASLIVCYLYPGAMQRLKEKFQTELKPGTLIVPYTFSVPEWKPFKVYEMDDFYCSRLYLYIKD